jgi:D-arabinose 5-phosphate isomerase GutQ
MKYNYLISDVDGVLTDGGHYYNNSGKFIKKFGSNDKDALKILNEKYFNKIIFVTADKNGFDISRKRIVDELGYELKLLNVKSERIDFFSKISKKSVYIGDGIYDSELFSYFDLSFSLLDSTPQAKKLSKVILNTNAGKNVFPFLLNHLDNLKQIKETVDENNFYKNLDLDYMIDSVNDLKKYKSEIYDFAYKIADSYSDTKKVVFCGVGKNALLSETICEFLQPFNVVSLTLDPHRAVHGNLGILNKDDILILSTKSGNTPELIYMMKCLRNKMQMNNIFLICSNNDAELVKEFDFKKILFLPKVNEIARFSHSPQTTILNYFIVMQIIVNRIVEKKEMTEMDYLLNHQAGEIGKVLQK